MSSQRTKVVAVTTAEELSQHSSNLTPNGLLVLYFHAPWAAPCAQMSAVLDALASTYEITQPPSIQFVSINAEELPDVSEEHDVTAVPYIVLQRGGSTVDTVSGSDAATVRKAVEKWAGLGSFDTKTGNSIIPPAQKVTRPDTQPVAPAPSSHQTPTSGAAPITANGAKDLSAYAPDMNPEPSHGKTTNSNAQKNNDGPSQDLQSRLKELTNAAPVMLFMKGTPSAPQCGFSRQLVGILRENSVRYGFFNILADEEVRQGLKEFADWPTFPQLWIGGELVGGLDIVREEIESNPDFFGDFSVAASANAGGGTSAPPVASDQIRPTAAT